MLPGQVLSPCTHGRLPWRAFVSLRVGTVSHPRILDVSPQQRASPWVCYKRSNEPPSLTRKVSLKLKWEQLFEGLGSDYTDLCPRGRCVLAEGCC